MNPIQGTSPNTSRPASKTDISSSAFGSANLSSVQPFTQADEQSELLTVTISELIDVTADLRGITNTLGQLKIGPKSAAEGNKSDNEKGVAKGNNGSSGVNGSSGRLQSTTTFSSSHIFTLEQLNALQSLQTHLLSLPLSQTSAYFTASRTCPAQTSPQRHLHYLETESFDIPATANRLALYWTKRLQFFGPDRAFLPMTLDGAMKQEVFPLQHCSMHTLLPVTDTAGRAIILANPNRMDLSGSFTVEQELRIMFYLGDCISRSASLRQNGYIVLGDVRNLGRKHFHPRLAECFSLLEQIFPLRGRGSHFCYPSRVAYYLIAPITKALAGRTMRLRFNMHHGSEEEVLRELEGFCLPRERVPTMLGGDLDWKVEDWIEERYRREVMGELVDERSGWDGIAVSGESKTESEGSDGDIYEDAHQQFEDFLGEEDLLKNGLGDVGDFLLDENDPFHPDRNAEETALRASHPSTKRLKGENDYHVSTPADALGVAYETASSSSPPTFASKPGHVEIDSSFASCIYDEQRQQQTILLQQQQRYLQPKQQSKERRDSFDDAISELPGLDGVGIDAEISSEEDDTPSSACPNPNQGNSHSCVKSNVHTRKRQSGGDERMRKAVEIRLNDPNMLLQEVLERSGFVFCSQNSKGQLCDADGITLRQRSNNLCRRIRRIKAAGESK